MFALLCSAHIFQHYKTLFCASSQIKCAPTDWLIKLLRLNDSFIPENMDTDFPETQTCFSHKMKNVNRNSYQWNIGITIGSITIIFNKSRAGSMLFEKDRWRFIFYYKRIRSINFFKEILHKAKRSSKRQKGSPFLTFEIDQFLFFSDVRFWDFLILH